MDFASGYVRKREYTEKILQIGEGNFLRAFADYLVDIMNEKILVVTKNSNDEIVRNETTVLELINGWLFGTDIPTNDDKVVSCILGETNLYFDTVGQLMEVLLGDKIQP